MATFTTNYNLRKPATSDYVTVTTDINDNMDDIDTQMKVNADAITALDVRSDAIEVQLASETVIDALADLVGATMDADWACTTITGYQIGRLRFLSLNLTYSGATLTGSAAGNITDENMITALPVAWRPTVMPAYFVYTKGGTNFGNGSIDTAGVVKLQTLCATGTVAAADVIAMSIAYFV